MESGEVRCVVFSAEKWIDVSLAEELRKRLLPGEKVIWRHAFRWQSDTGPLPNHYEHASAASLAAEFGYQVIVDAGCAAIIRDPKASVIPRDAGKEGQPRLFAKGLKAIHDAAPAEQVSAIDGIPEDWVEFVNLCAGNSWLAVEENTVSRRARELLNRVKFEGDRPGHREAIAIQMLVDAGFVTAAKANEALQIAFGGRAGPLKPAANRSWWKDVKPETDLADANDVIVCMLEDWQKVGEALGFKDFADPESIIGLCKELFDESPKPDTAEALALLDGIIAKFERDNERGFDTDLLSLRRILTAGVSPEKVVAPPADEFADIREFRRREAEMDRRDAERASAAYEAAMRGMFPYKEVASIAARDAASAYMGTVMQEFDALPIGAASIPEAPVPMPSAPSWKRDEEKTMLRILLLSGDTTGFHGNDPAVHLAKIAKWTDAECRAVDEWCVAMHHQAADSGVSVPPKPIVLAPSSFADDARPESICGRITKLIAAETRYPEHHFTPVAMTIAQMFNYVDEEALSILNGVLAKFELDDEFGVTDDLLALRTRLTQNKRLQS